MSKQAGPMEARVRAALLRLWKTIGEHVAHRAWTSDDVAREVLDDGKGGVMRFLKLSESVQRIGRNVAKGKGFNCSPSGWSELEDGIEFTYERGDFIVRCARSSKPVGREKAKPCPALSQAHSLAMSKNVFVQFGQPYRNAHPEHFHRAVAHGLAVVAAGAHPNLLGVLSRGAMARGLADASEGYTHARLRLMAAGVDGR